MARDTTVEIAYAPFKTFLTALDTLRQGIPDPLDRSVFRNQSGSTQAMLISSMRALGAIDADGHKQPVLDRLVNPDERRTALKEVLEDKYRDVINLGLSASQKQFDDCFYEYGVRGDTHKKAKSFFLQAAQMAGIPLSPHVAGPRGAATEGESNGTPTAAAAPRRRRARSKKDNGAGGAAPPSGGSSRGSSKTVQMRTGGEITMTVSIDPMELEDDDRRFVFDLIDKLKAYEKAGGPPARASSGAAES